MLPLLLDMTDRLAVVIGSGPVGRRKLGVLLEAKARVRWVSIVPHVDLALTNSGVTERIIGPYQSHYLDGADFVFAAATDEVNAVVVADAIARRIWVNSASDPQSGNFFVPAVVRRGDLVIAIGTGGNAPAVAANIREKFELEFDDAWGTWIEFLGRCRRTILATVADPSKRARIFERLSDLHWVDRLRAEGSHAVESAVRRIVAEIGCSETRGE